jgi:hypothetical protein
MGHGTYFISPPLKALRVDDEEIALLSFSGVLRHSGFPAATASYVLDASNLIIPGTLNRLQQNLASVDFSVLLLEVMTIADEVDSQLTQAMESYVAGSLLSLSA